MSKKRSKTKTMLWIALFIIVASIVAVVGCYWAVTSAAEGRMYTDVSKTPERRVALLLGTSPIVRSGKPNQFFLRRIDATAKLYKAGKFSKLIISGANRPEEFNEPEEMKAALVRQGVPGSIMQLDGEGFRTINSIVRAKDVYGADSILIISQELHNQRALFFAKHKGIEAVAFNASNTSSRKWRIKMLMRESLARVKATIEAMGL
jgi:SanA protein